MVIHLLDNSIINKIAAGEVIERPSSVVKELLENSFDAGADSIKIEIEDAGLVKIKISDNGCGMDRRDLLISYKRHATSKIKSADDLFDIHSLGFRGEALASIAEISNLTIKTKPSEETLGQLIEVEAGNVKKEEEVSCPDGTIVEVRNLFFNVPTRKNYLKTREYEFSKIMKIVTKYALNRKDVGIVLVHDGREVLNSQKTDSFLNNVVSVYGAEVGRDLFEVNYSDDYMKINGFVSKPSLTRSTKDEQSVYVNSRYVKDKTISDGVYSALHTYLFTGRHPIFVLDIEIAPSEIDVNVHPAKELIRLKDEDKVGDIVKKAVKSCLEQVNLVRDVDLETGTSAKASHNYEFSRHRQENLFEGAPDSEKMVPVSYSDATQGENKVLETFVSDEESSNIFENFNILGQVNKTYVICESPEGVVIIDQHAAEERVNYEKFMKEYMNLSVRRQTLLQPRVIELTPAQKQAAVVNYDFFVKFGYDFSDFGDNSIKLSMVPESFANLKSILFIDIVNELINLKSESIDMTIEEKIIRMSCRASVKAGDELTISEIRKLLIDLSKCENPYSCPHGRPTIINLSIADLEKKFKRTGW